MYRVGVSMCVYADMYPGYTKKGAHSLTYALDRFDMGWVHVVLDLTHLSHAQSASFLRVSRVVCMYVYIYIIIYT